MKLILPHMFIHHQCLEILGLYLVIDFLLEKWCQKIKNGHFGMSPGYPSKIQTCVRLFKRQNT